MNIMLFNRFCWMVMAVLMLGSGCKTRQSPASEAEKVLTPEVISSGQNCGVTQPGNYFIEDQDAWEKLWAEVTKGQIPTPPVPEVEFGEEVIVGFFMGQQNTGGYEVELKKAVLSNQELVLQLIFHKPGPGCFTTMALTQPFLLVKFKQAGIERINFSTEEMQQEC